MFNLIKKLRKLTEGRAHILGEEAPPVIRPNLDAEVRRPEDNKIRVFVFETLMNPDVRRPVLKADVEIQDDTLPNFKEINVESEGGTNYHTIVPALGNFIRGLVLYVDEKELARLDWWEDQYDRIKCVLGSGNRAYVYVIKLENMKDAGKNTEVALNPDDIEQIAWASQQTMESLSAKKSKLLGEEERYNQKKTAKGFWYYPNQLEKERLGYSYLQLVVPLEQNINDFDGIPGYEIIHIKLAMKTRTENVYTIKMKAMRGRT